MARGRPALWSGLLGGIFVVAGYDVYAQAVEDPTALLPVEVGYGLVAFGVFVALVGLYVSRAAPDAPTLREDEQIVEVRVPTQRVARLHVTLSLPLFALTIYLYYETTVDYAYPAITMMLAFLLLSNALVSYWRNTLTTYYVTTDRVLSEYRFLSLSRREIPMSSIRSIEERQSLVETMTGIGNVRVASGGGRNMVIAIRNINGSAELADAIRGLR